VLTNPGGDSIYRWALDGETLSLTLEDLADPAEISVVRLMTEHRYTVVATG
jgi:hypothetical protein